MSQTPGEIALEHNRCPRCGAWPGQKCRTRTGGIATSIHQPRVRPVIQAWAAGHEEGQKDPRRTP
ncbi:zinc finger domain-containing protein [Nesterenkonia rhizosphaerae]|uniref:DNA-binding phage zinc finger domain-containing protein n=1 Tax=Nesterenkonia rhizosphaerae TaxID=1348272 RepID=A0ABP9FTE0_9MICC